MNKHFIYILACRISIFLWGTISLFSLPTTVSADTHTSGKKSQNNYDVYLLIGQSNMAGRGKMTDKDTTEIIPNVFLLNEEGIPVPAQAPLNRYSSIRKNISQQQIGPGNSFGDYMRRYTGRKILLVVNARGGSSISSWSPENTSHHYFKDAVERTHLALEHGTLKGILWHQGETDVEKNTKDYSSKFIHMATRLREELNAPNVPIAIGELGQWEWAEMSRIKSFNDSILNDICRRLPLCVKVHSDDLKRLYKDKAKDPHFGREAQIELGKRYADALLPMITDIYVTPFYQGKQAAISFTFDDGDEEHATLVAPELEKRGFRGTFWIIGSIVGTQDEKRPRLTWEQLREMTERGHEVSNHSWSHPNLTRIDEQAVLAEILRTDSAIETHTGVRPTTFCYPYNSSNAKVRKLASAGRVGTRLKQVGHGQQNNKSTPEKLSQWLHRTLEFGDWGVTMTHGINIGYDKWYHPEVLWNFFDEVKKKEDSIWVATFKDVSAYKAEREHLLLQVRKRKNKIIIRPRLALDKKLFRHPLTMKIKGDWQNKEVEIRQRTTRIIPQIKEGYLLFDFKPDGGRIHIKHKEK